MFKSSIRILTLTVVFGALVATPALVPALAAGGGDPGSPDIMRPSSSTSTPPADTKGGNTRSSQKGKKAKQSFLDEPGFARGYHEAYTSIYDRHDYAAAIDELKALGHDDYANVANLIGYSYRKLGDYKVSQIWYERALKADPNHVKTWQYYGLWQVEQGNRDQAQYHLNKIAQLTGTTSEEYRSLAEAMQKPPGTGLVY